MTGCNQAVYGGNASGMGTAKLNGLTLADSDDGVSFGKGAQFGVIGSASVVYGSDNALFFNTGDADDAVVGSNLVTRSMSPRATWFKAPRHRYI